MLAEWLSKADEILQRALGEQSLALRRIAGEGIGLLARLGPDSYLQKVGNFS